MRQVAALEQVVGGVAHPGALAVVHGLLGQPEVAPSAPAHLDDDERPRRAGIDGDDVQLVAADTDGPREDRPAGGDQAVDDDLLRGIARPALGRPSVVHVR